MEEIKAAELIYLLLEEGKFAEVAALLFSHHKRSSVFGSRLNVNYLPVQVTPKSCLWLQLC